MRNDPWDGLPLADQAEMDAFIEWSRRQPSHLLFRAFDGMDWRKRKKLLRKQFHTRVWPGEMDHDTGLSVPTAWGTGEVT